MSDLLNFVNSLRRPRLLLNAAKFGMSHYNRAKSLRRLAPSQNTTSAFDAVKALIATEDNLEQARQAGDASYAPSRHVEVLIALLAEARELRRPKLVQ